MPRAKRDITTRVHDKSKHRQNYSLEEVLHRFTMQKVCKLESHSTQMLCITGEPFLQRPMLTGERIPGAAAQG